MACKHPNYIPWYGMKLRCDNKKRQDYNHYGGRGITYCKSWKSFENFNKDMGTRSPGMTLDRINVNKGYFKSNCRWATRLEQCSNTRANIWVKIEGKKMILKRACELVGLNYSTVKCRINQRGWSPQDAVETPVGVRNHSL